MSREIPRREFLTISAKLVGVYATNLLDKGRLFAQEDTDYPTTPEPLPNTFNETAAILENALFYPENQTTSTNGMYQLNISQGYLDNVAKAGHIYFDQRSFDNAVDYSIELVFDVLNEGLRNKNLPEKTLNDIVRFKPFVQRGGHRVGEGEIEGTLSNGIVHYVCTTREMVAIREEFRKNLTNQDFIETSFLFGSNSMSLGFIFFDDKGRLVMVTKRLHNDESVPYVSRSPIVDSISAGIMVGLADSMLFAEVGASVLMPKAVGINDIFGCYPPSWNCNPNLVSIQ